MFPNSWGKNGVIRTLRKGDEKDHANEKVQTDVSANGVGIGLGLRKVSGQ